MGNAQRFEANKLNRKKKKPNKSTNYSKMTVKEQLHYLLMHWYRIYNVDFEHFPKIIATIIIDTYTYQPYFQIQHNMRLQEKYYAQEDYDYYVKFAIVGNSATGKTSIMNRYMHNKFTSKYEPNIVVNIETKIIRIHNFTKTLKIQIWDLPGEEKWYALITKYCECSDGVIIVYDAMDNSFLKTLQEWNQRVGNHGIPKIIVANKCDVRKMSKNNEQELTSLFPNFPNIECSAKKNMNIDTVFNVLIKQAIYYMNHPFFGQDYWNEII
eukprot:104525_1